MWSSRAATTTNWFRDFGRQSVCAPKSKNLSRTLGLREFRNVAPTEKKAGEVKWGGFFL
jgi:hypothetical protein